MRTEASENLDLRYSEHDPATVRSVVNSTTVHLYIYITRPRNTDSETPQQNLKRII